MNKLMPILLAVLLCLLAAPVMAQSAWQTTGSVTGTIDGRQVVFNTYAKYVPEDVAADIEDEAAKEFAQRVAGTEQHSATWMVMDAMMAGPIVIVPATMYVTISARGDADPLADAGQLDIEFPLDPATLTRLTDSEPEITYYPESFNTSDFYALTEGELEIDSIEVAGDNAIAVTGSIRGTLSRQDGYDIVHNPSDTLPIEVTFDIERVVGSELLTELVTEEVK